MILCTKKVLMLICIDSEQNSDQSNKEPQSDLEDENELDEQSESDEEPIDHTNHKLKKSHSDSFENTSESESNSNSHGKEEDQLNDSLIMDSKSKIQTNMKFL